MSQRLTNNFKKRFGDRIQFNYLDKPLRGTERQIQNQKIVKAYSELLAGILKREPTPDELSGLKQLSAKKR